MNRRKAMKVAAGVIVGSGAGLYALTNAFKPEYLPLEESQTLEYNNAKTSWEYYPLDPAQTAQLAYRHFDSGSCMYATFKSIISQLADKFGEPYISFPLHMMKYGHGGVGGFGTICGALNGAAAIIGLFVTEKAMQDSLITGLFRWYEETKLPEFRPQTAILDFTPPSTISNSTLCHASNTIWVKEAGYKVNSNERKERCRRLASDVASRVTAVLNEYFSNTYVTKGHDNETVRQCMTCHGDKGKLINTSTKMECTSCHTESIGHRLFADIHYKTMKAK
jgi:Putative redox-active protein (C_GCAxxG_C_C)